MTFNLQEFKRANFQHRKADLELPGLAGFFPEGEKPIITVRGLTGPEVSEVKEEVQTATEVYKLVEAAETKTKAVSEAVRLLTSGSKDSLPVDHVRELHIVQMGIVKPAFKYEDVVKFAGVFPIEFGLIAQKIYVLTGLGQEQKKRRASGATPK
ncbi:MAG: hypothetical protein JRD69_10170 [Deltaproteobacteria bacterium]|nr:hypothetical protein [Deltaproteobacteria bacterium]